MVVPVLITNCHVSLNLNKGPVIIQTRIVADAIKNADGLPDTRAVDFAKLENHEVDLNGRIFFSSVLFRRRHSRPYDFIRIFRADNRSSK
jgi:hypothetical protein